MVLDLRAWRENSCQDPYASPPHLMARTRLMVLDLRAWREDSCRDPQVCAKHVRARSGSTGLTGNPLPAVALRPPAV